jgi:hypothetical protein
LDLSFLITASLLKALTDFLFAVGVSEFRTELTFAHFLVFSSNLLVSVISHTHKVAIITLTQKHKKKSPQTNIEKQNNHKNKIQASRKDLKKRTSPQDRA